MLEVIFSIYLFIYFIFALLNFCQFTSLVVGYMFIPTRTNSQLVSLDYEIEHTFHNLRLQKQTKEI